jgi:hypothetical protein
MHPTLDRLMRSWAGKVEDGHEDGSLVAQARLTAALAGIGAHDLYEAISKEAHRRPGSYAANLDKVTVHIRKEGVPPDWSLASRLAPKGSLRVKLVRS